MSPPQKAFRRRLHAQVLEDRWLLAGDGFAHFAAYTGIARAGEPASFPLRLSSELLSASRWGDALVSFHVQSDSADPAAAQVHGEGGQPLTPRVLRSNLPDAADSLAIFHMPAGQYTVAVNGEPNTPGVFSMQVGLTGDLNGNRRVQVDDLLRVVLAIRNHLEGLPAEGAADIDGDGVLAPGDLFLTLLNFHAESRIGPLAVTSAPPEAEQVGQIFYTHATETTLLLQTTPGAVAEHLNDATPQDPSDSRYVANQQGNAQVPVPLHAGLNTFRFRVTDPLGQERQHIVQIVRLAPDEDPPAAPQLFNQAITTDAGVQQMPSVAVNPLDPEHVVIAYMDYSLPTADANLQGEGYAGIGVAVSRNGGATWQHSAISIPEPFNEGAAHPIAKFDDQGRLFVTFMAATFLGPRPHLTNMDVFNSTGNASDRVFGFESHNGVFVARSDDGGLTWGEPATVVSHLFDGVNKVNFEIQPDIGIDTFPLLSNGQPNPNHGNLYITWSRNYVPGQFPGHPEIDGGIDLMIAVSRDGGQTWETQLQTKIDDNGDPYLATVIEDSLNTVGLPGLAVLDNPRIAIGPAGEIYLTGASCGDLGVLLSRDGGATFDELDHVTGHRIAFGLGCSTGTSTSPLPNNRFRKNWLAAPAADPARPGRAYVVVIDDIFDASGKLIGPDVLFAHSEDQGVTWQELLVEHDTPDPKDDIAALNDDNDRRKATGAPTDVTTHQVMVRLTADALGNIGVIWVDTRRDPGNHLLDVFGTTSTDGGRTFSPNFRITDMSFDADEGRFTNALGNEEFFIGDFIGLDMADNTAYAAWTDTRNGNQDIFFARYPIDPVPAALNDRLEPNVSSEPTPGPTALGRVVQKLLPKLTITPDDEDWFSLEAAATGDLIATALFECPAGRTRCSPDERAPAQGDAFPLEIRDESGATLLAAATDLLDTEGNLIGREARVPGAAGDKFSVRVVGAGSETLRYSLRLQSLTADLGARAFTSVEGAVTAGGGALYLVGAAAPGSLDVRLTGGANVQGDLNLQILDAETLAVLQSGQPGPALTANSTEPNDSISEASPTGLVEPGSVTLDSTIGDGSFGATSGDLDFYRFEAGANHRITIEVNAVAVGSNLDSLIAVYDSNGQRLHAVDGAGSGANEVVTFTTDKADTYFVAVMGWESFPPADPFAAGTGARAGSTGAFRLAITSAGLGPGGEEQASVPVRQGQSLLVLVGGDDAGSAGDFTLDITNADQFATSEKNALFFVAGPGPSQAEVGDLNGDGHLDIVVTDALSDTLNVLAGSGNGTFQAPRQFAVGAFEPPPGDLPQRLANFGRDVALADFNQDGILDAAVTNRVSSDVSILLGRGDGGFEPQRRFDATFSPIALETGDLNGDNLLDLAVVSSGTPRHTLVVATLLGRGDGTFEPQRTLEVPTGGEVFNLGAIQIGELNGDGKADLVVTGSGDAEAAVVLGNGDGTFALLGRIPGARLSVGLAVADINQDGHLDILSAGFDHKGQISVMLGNGVGAFQQPVEFLAGQSPVALDMVDWGSQIKLPDGSTVLGPPDGHPDVVVAVSDVVVFLRQVEGPPGVVVLPGLFDEQGQFEGLGRPILLAQGEAPQDIDVGDLNGDGALDVVAVDRGGVLVVYGRPSVIAPNTTPQTARDLGTVVHLVQPTQTITPRAPESFFTLIVPEEVVAGAGDQVIDFSALFTGEVGPGLNMEVRNAAGNLLGAGERFRVRAAQGEELQVRIFGLEDDGERGYGAYTLAIDVLPQVVSVEAHALLPGEGGNPGGPTTSIILSFQGDRLETATAENAANYTVTFLGADDALGTADDVVIPVANAVYSPGTNVDVSTGITRPTAIKQTVTLLFDKALPAGDYRVQVSPNVQAVAFSEEELALLSPRAGFTGHPVVSLDGGSVQEGADLIARDLVMEAVELGDFSVFNDGTRFLEQLHDDLIAVLDGFLTEQGDAPQATQALIDQVLARFTPALAGPDGRLARMLVLVLDPISFNLLDPDGNGISYDLATQQYVQAIEEGFVDVSGNVEVVVLPEPPPMLMLNVSHVPDSARGLWVSFDANAIQMMNLTEPLRHNQTSFTIHTTNPNP